MAVGSSIGSPPVGSTMLNKDVSDVVLKLFGAMLILIKAMVAAEAKNSRNSNKTAFKFTLSPPAFVFSSQK